MNPNRREFFKTIGTAAAGFGVGPPLNISDIPSSARLASATNFSPIYAMNF